MKTALIMALLLCLIIDVCILAFSVTRKDSLRSLYFTMAGTGVGLYLLGYLLQVLCNSLEAAMVAIKVQNIGIPLLGPSYLLFLLGICQYKQLRRWMVYVTGGYGLFMFSIVLFNEYHLLYYPTASFVPIGDMYYVILGHGPLYYVQQVISMLCILISYVALAHRMRIWSATTRKRMTLIFISSLAPVVNNLLYVTGNIPQYVDPMPFLMLAGLICCAVTIIKYNLFDITLAASEAAIMTMDDAMVVLDTDWCHQYANAAAIKLFPDLANFQGIEPIDRVKEWPKSLVWCTSAGNINFELGAGENIRYYTARVSQVGGDVVIGWSIVIRDITENTHLLEKMKTLAITDSLTDIYNRRYFIEAVKREMEIASRQQIMSAMVIFDLDHFKNINDTYGHQIGDVVLQTVTRTIQCRLRKYDVFARYGGEEFALFITNIDSVNALSFTNRLCEAIADIRIPHGEETISITASFGLVPVHWEDDLNQAIIAADEAMYVAKNRGRNQVVMGSSVQANGGEAPWEK